MSYHLDKATWRWPVGISFSLGMATWQWLATRPFIVPGCPSVFTVALDLPTITGALTLPAISGRLTIASLGVDETCP